MKRNLAVAGVLCLAVVALLGIAAAPAAAQDGCECHTAVPPTNDAPAAHAPFVASVTDCTACHRGWSPHPAPAEFESSGVWLDFNANTLNGKAPTWGAATTVYLQQRPRGSTEFTDIGQVTTTYTRTFMRVKFYGPFSLTVPSPTPWASYRAIRPGWVVSGPRLPAIAVWRPTPDLTGVLHARFTARTVYGLPIVRLGTRVRVSGSVAPAESGAKLTILVRRERAVGGWVTRLKVTPAIVGAGTDKGTYSWAWTPKVRGKFAVVVRLAATETFAGNGLQAQLGGRGIFRVR